VTFPIAVLASGTGSNLQALLDKIHGRDGIEIVGVATNKPDAQALTRARDAGVETAAFPVGDYADREARDQALADWLEDRGVQLVVLAGFMEILSSGLIARFRGRIVNVHPSLLPAFPGVRSIEQALDYGVKVTGVTVHFVDEGVDSGPIIMQEAFELPYHRDIEGVEKRVHEIEHELLPRVVKLIAAGAVQIDGRRVRVGDGEG
jgi:phosphoribosylglycinamide formyltransferase-1